MALFKRKVKFDEFCDYTFRKSLTPIGLERIPIFTSKEAYNENIDKVDLFIKLASTLIFISHILYLYKIGAIKGPIHDIEKRMVDSSEKIYNELGFQNRSDHMTYQVDFIEDLGNLLSDFSAGENLDTITNDLCEYLINKYDSKYSKYGFIVGSFVHFETGVVIKTMLNNTSKIKIVD